MTPTIGDVQLLPPEPDPGGDTKDRPHVLLTHARTPSETLTFAYATTQQTDAAPVPLRPGAAPPAPAPHVVVDPQRPGTATTSFRHRSYVLLNRLFSVGPEGQGPRIGRVVDELTAMRAGLPGALGIGTGGGPVGAPPGSKRGLVVEFHRHVTDLNGARLGVVVMDPAFSARARIVTVVPLYDAAVFEPLAGEVTFAVAGGDEWLRALGMAHAFAAVGDIFGAWWQTRVSRPLPAYLPDDAMRRVDVALCAHFDLPASVPRAQPV